MARISLSQQLELALVRANKAEQENRDLKEILKTTQNRTNRAQSQTSTRSGAQSRPAQRGGFVSLSERAKAYCAAHGVKTCTKQDLLNWNPGH